MKVIRPRPEGAAESEEELTEIIRSMRNSQVGSPSIPIPFICHVPCNELCARCYMSRYWEWFRFRRGCLWRRPLLFFAAGELPTRVEASAFSGNDTLRVSQRHMICRRYPSTPGMIRLALFGLIRSSHTTLNSLTDGNKLHISLIINEGQAFTYSFEYKADFYQIRCKKQPPCLLSSCTSTMIFL